MCRSPAIAAGLAASFDLDAAEFFGRGAVVAGDRGHQQERVAVRRAPRQSQRAVEQPTRRDAVVHDLPSRPLGGLSNRSRSTPETRSIGVIG
ncbi:hypothetical protein SSOG_09012 [Streptomyces himastatinicus ATCC 53653]|uniref:Uncharacterized protein n=1 Tax=Streptomyces himastatinicus ATCC 53653 TaxID=457427 RepID=D9WL23_9ACTN|nr:hypothetical protein SSOG_09012 [Streptomyces himastatinicus ATCC 53653]